MRRHIVFRHSWWIALLLAISLCLAVFASPLHDQGALAGAVIGVAAAFCYFAQQQRLQELSLFKQLFGEFNKRYDDLNDDLAEIEAGTSGLTPERRRQRIVDYFN